MTPYFLKNIYFENSVIWLTLLWNCPITFCLETQVQNQQYKKIVERIYLIRKKKVDNARRLYQTTKVQMIRYRMSDSYELRVHL